MGQLKPVNNLSQLLVGHPVERMEDARFLSCSGLFVDDVARDGMLHAAILRSPIAHALIASIDSSEALATPGAHAIIIAADLGGNVLDAAKKLCETILQRASDHLGRPNTELSIANDHVVAANGASVPLTGRA